MSKIKIPFLVVCWIAVVFIVIYGLCPSVLADEAQFIYRDAKTRVYQIQVIDLASGKKHVIGSGFQIDPQGYLATNYHVISPIVHHPNKYRIEFLANDGRTGALKLAGIDVIHDLAIVRCEQAESGDSLLLGNSKVEKGTKIFSLGNPYDLGMTIIEGIYNGEMEHSQYKKILFSGSLNPGMSGGPALDHDGKVIGINVATQGNQISFLVPVEYLKDLYDLVSSGKVSNFTWREWIQKQLLEHQELLVKSILSSDWKDLAIGEAVVPGELNHQFRCWGNLYDRAKSFFRFATSECSNDDVIFLSNTFLTNRIIYKYGWVTNKGVNSLRFYNYYESVFSVMEDFNTAGEEDVSNFQCRSEFVKIDQRDFKVSFCAREYKNFKELYDIDLSMASVDRFDRGLIVQLTAFGVSQKSSRALIDKFMKGITWKE